MERRSPDPRPGVSVLVVNWNSGGALADCLSSLVAVPPEVACEVVIVDNGSDDDSVSRAQAVLPTARIIRNSSNRGLPAANNQAMVACRGDVMLICNPDVMFKAGAVDALVATMNRHPRAAFVVPRLLHADGSLQTSVGDLPTLGEAFLGRQVMRSRGTGTFWADGWAHDREQVIGRGHESAYLVRREAVADIGLQDERFVLDWEGIDWTERARSRGWQVWFCPEAEVVHLGGVSIRQVPLRWIVSSHRGMYRYWAKRRSVWWRPLLGAAFGSRALVKVALHRTGLATYERGHQGRAS